MPDIEHCSDLALELAATVQAFREGRDPFEPDGPGSITEWDLAAAAWRALARERETEADRLRGLLTLWVNLAPVELRTLVPGPNGKSLVELTREAFDRTKGPISGVTSP